MRLRRFLASRTDGSTDCATLRRRERTSAPGVPSVSALWGNVVTCNREGGR